LFPRSWLSGLPRSFSGGPPCSSSSSAARRGVVISFTQ
jgi:hypothetical protein